MLRQQREDEQEYFECPAGCSTFLLVPLQTSYRIVEGRPVARLGQCSCGAVVCPKCKKLVISGGPHLCSEVNAELRALRRAAEEKNAAALAEVKRKEESDEKAAIAVAASIGKKCPRCSMFIVKNDGCQWMCCGTCSAGRLSDIIRNGGCGFCFDWNTGKECPLSDTCHNSFIDLDDVRRNGRLVLARSVPGHPKCQRPECPYFMTVDACGGPQGHNNGGEYCCECCARDGSHHKLCHKIRFDEKASLAETAMKEDLLDLDKAPVKYFEPFAGRHVRLTWPGGQDIKDHSFHAQFLGDGDKLLSAVQMRVSGGKTNWQPAADLNFGAKGLKGDNWRVDLDFGVERLVVGIKTDAGPRLQFTVHYSEDADNWVPYSGQPVQFEYDE